MGGTHIIGNQNGPDGSQIASVVKTATTEKNALLVTLDSGSSAAGGPTAAQVGAVTETAPATDTASSGLNGRLQRIAQRLTSLIALLPASIGQKLKATSLAVTLASDEDLLTNVGGVTETAPANDTASSGLNGRLQRIAQRLTTLIAGVPILKTATSVNSPTLASDFGTVTKANVKNATGNVFAIAFANANAGLRFAQLHNKATAPAGADVPLYSFPLPAGTAAQPTLVVIGEDFFSQNGKNFTTGIGWAVSTTLATFTDTATASDHSTYVHYA